MTSSRTSGLVPTLATADLEQAAHLSGTGKGDRIKLTIQDRGNQFLYPDVFHIVGVHIGCHATDSRARITEKVDQGQIGLGPIKLYSNAPTLQVLCT